VTTRIRREAAETRSRSQLREAERAELRLRRWEVRRSRFRRVVVPWRLRLAIVATAGLVLAGGMLGLLRLAGGPLEVATAPVADTSGSDAAETSPVPSASGSTSPAAVTTTAPPGGPAVSATLAAPVAAASRDPVGVLQQLADRRAAALMAADPALLAGVEPAGSSAHQSDRKVVERLREQRQRYADLAFVVRSAEVVSTAEGVVVLRAVVDRSAYRVVADGADAQAVDAAPGGPLQYTLSLADGTWRLTEVTTP